MSIVDNYWNKNQVPTIHQNRNREWELTLSLDDFSVRVVIRHDYADEETLFKIYHLEHGIDMRVMSDEEFDNCVQAIAENDPDPEDAIEDFYQNNQCPQTGGTQYAAAYHIGKKLVQRWESFVNLNIFSPSITL